MKLHHVILGCICWLAAGVAGIVVLRSELSEQSSSLGALAADLGQWVTAQQQTHTARSVLRIAVAREDPIFVETEDGKFRQIGHVLDVAGSSATGLQFAEDIRVVLYDEATQRFPNGYFLEYYTTPMALDWAVKMLIPPERQRQIADMIRSDWERHGEEVMAELQPVMQAGLRQAIQAVEAEMPDIIHQHRDEFRALGDHFEAEILQQELLPLVRDEILPVIREEAEPLVKEIGRALWRRVSLWSFTWRYVYDATPLGDGDAVQSEFDRFLTREAVPELESRTDDLIRVTRSIIQRCLANPLVKDSLRRNLQRVAEDPQLQQIVWRIVRSATIDNETLRRKIEEFSTSPETRFALRVASDRLEPTVRSIGDMIFGTRATGITPEFSRILRSQILEKDRRWFVLKPRSATAKNESDLTINIAESPMLYPLRFAGDRQSPLTPVDIKSLDASDAEESDD